MDATPYSDLNILMVDDDSFMLDYVAAELREMGVQFITTARDGEQGIAAFDRARAKPNLILCDLHMPGQDGFQFMQQLGQRDFSGGIALISGQDDRILQSAALMAQFHHLHILGALAKPVNRDGLEKLIAKLSMSKEALALMASSAR